jgi:SAM-dependent methyltransferase
VSHSVRRHLHVEIEEYDAQIRRFIPGYEEMIATAAARALSGAPGRVLDIGSGTGALAAAVLGRSEGVTVELLDVDPEMLDQARVRLEPFGGRAVFTVGSFLDPLPRADAMMASLSLHHIPTLEEKAAMYARIGEALPSGGIFVNADATLPTADPERADTWRHWADHMVAHGIAEEDAWRHFESWSEEDTYFPLEDELRAMREAGLAAECVWREGISTVTVGRLRREPRT